MIKEFLKNKYSDIKISLNKITFIPNSFFDVRFIAFIFAIIFFLDFFYGIFILKDTIVFSFFSALFYPAVLLMLFLIYTKILANLKKDLLIPRRWVNFGISIIIMIVIAEKLIFDWVFKTSTNLPLVLVAFVTIVSIVFGAIMNLWLKISDKNISKIHDINNKNTLYKVLFEYGWEWMEWVHKINLEKTSIKFFIKNFHVREASDFFDNYTTFTPYVLSYASQKIIGEYRNLMLQIVEINNIRIDIIKKGYHNQTDIERLLGRKGDMLLSLEFMFLYMKEEIENRELTQSEKEIFIDIIRNRNKIKTLKDKVIF